METDFKGMIVRHRFGIRDAVLAIALILLLGLAAYEYSFIGAVQDERRIEFEEMLVLTAVVVGVVVYLGWRRVVDLEREIRRRLGAERRAHELAHTDALTGLANRRAFERALAAATKAPPGAEEVHAVLMLDLNGFKKINDVYGHAEGDEVLIGIAARLKSATRDRDLVARLGGDEFAILALHLTGPEGATSVAMRVIAGLQDPIQVQSRAHRVGLGIGIALSPRDGDEADEILRKADIALYRAKAEPQSAVHFFEEEMDRHVRERSLMERELAAAIGTPGLRPWYQPIVDLGTNRVVGFEALARWSHPELGDVPPDRFIPIAESCGLIRELGDSLLRQALTDARSWPEHVILSFNISPAQLKDRTLGLRILGMLAETGVSPRRLEIEITESAIVRDLEAAQEVLSSLREAGVSIALDDFGTGYSSLYHLRNFKLDKIKIDRSFVHAMGSEEESAAIVRALAGLGNGLGLTTVAEGIESAEECDALLQQGCQQGQGFLFSQAVPASETAAFFARQGAASKQGAAG
jgi:diguanylate cyclase (GGDEF)-like protein